MEKTKTEINCTTGEEITRPLTKAELAQLELDKAESAAREAELTIKAQAKAEAEAKLSTLGLTTDDLRALGL